MPNFLVNVAVAVLKTVGMKAAAVAAIGQTGLAVIGGSILVGGALVAKKVMGLFEIQMPKIDTDSSRQSTNKGTTEPHKIIYGETLVSGPVVFVATAGTDNKDLYYAVALAGHEVEDITDIHFDNEVIADADIAATTSTASTSGAVSGSGTFGPKGSPSTTICHVNKHLGTATQAADSLLRAAKPSKWTTAHQGKGIAYIVTKWVLNDDSAETWDKFTPNNIKAVVKGRKIYDPRLDSTQTDISGSGSHRLADSTTWAYSTNPALAVADYLMNADFGLGVSSSKIDWAAIKTAADGCDVSVSVPGGTQSRFTCNGVLFGTDSHKTNINKLLSAMNGSIAYIDGYYVVKAGIHENPVVDLDEDDLSGSISIKTSLERGDRFNTVKGVFIDPASNYKSTEFPKVQLSTAYNRDNDEELHKEIALNMTNSSYMAQRIAHKLIQQSDLQKIITYPTNMKGLRVAVGDRVRVTNTELNWTLKEFQCVQWSFNEEGGVTLLLREENSQKYADPTVTPNNEYSTITSDGVLEDAFRGVPTPSGLRVVSGEGKVFLDWVNPGNPQEFQTVHVLVSSDNNLANAVKAGETDGSQFVHDSAASAGDATEYAVGDTRYYWVRAVNFVGTSNEARSSAHGSQSVTVLATAVTWSNVANPTIGIQLDTDDSIEIVYNAETQTSGSAIATSGIEEDVTITQGGITMSSGGAIKGGQTAFNSGTGFFLGYDSSAYKFSIGNSSGEKLTFDGSDLSVTGDINATSGLFEGSIAIGSGNDIFKADSNGIYLGNATFGSAPFRVTPAGALTATNATITGAVTATSGTFTGTVNASAGAFTGDVTTNSKFTAGSSDDVAVVDGSDVLYRFYAGDASAENAAFRVDKDGHIDARDIRIYDENGQVILDATGLHGSGLGDISANAGVGVAEVAGRLDDNADEITFTTGTASEAYTFETKVQLDINQNGESGETPTTSNLSFAGADQSAVTTIIGQVKLIVEYFVKVSGGSYSATPTATDEFTFVSGTSASSSQLGVNVFTLGSRGAGVVYANVGASEAIADPSISGARLFVKSTKDITFSTAATHNVKVNARIATTSGTTLTTSTTPALDDSVTTGTGVILGSDETQSSLEDFRRLYTIKPASGNTKTIIASTTDDTFSSTGGSSLLTSGGTISGNLTVTGDFTVQGTTTTLDTATLNVEDKNITVNYATGDSSGSADGAGITIQDAVDASTDATILWDQTNSEFDFSHGGTFAGNVTATALNLGDNSTNEIPIAFLSSSTDFALGANGNNFMLTQSTGDLDSNALLTISSTGNATFAGTVTGGNGSFTNLTIDATEKLRFDGAGGHTYIQESANDTLTFATGGSARLTLDANATFSGQVTGNGGVLGDPYLWAKAAAGAIGVFLDSKDSFDGTNLLNAPMIEWREADGTNIAGIRGYVDASGNNNLALGTGFFDEEVTITSSGMVVAGNIRASEQSVFTGNAISGTPNSNAQIVAADSGVAGIAIHSDDGGQSYIWFGDNTNNAVGRIYYSHSADKVFWRVGGTNDVHTLDSSGNATFAGELDVNLSAAGKYFEGGSGNVRRLSITSGTNVSEHAKHTFDIASSNGKYVFSTNSVDRLTLDSSGATFAGTISSGAITSSGNITATNQININSASYDNRQIGMDSNGFFIFNAADSRYDLKISDADGTATFANNVTIPAIAYVGTSIVHQGDSDTSIDFAGANDLRIYAAGLEHATFDGTIVFNQGGADMDLRVEGSGNQNLLMTDAGNDRVAIGHNSPDGIFHVKTSGSVQRSRFESGSSHSFVRIIGSTGSNAGLEFFSGSGNVGNITADSSSNLLFEPSGTEKMRLSSGGTLHLNNYTASNAKLRAQQTTTSEWVANFINYTAAAYGVSIDTSSATTSSTYNFAAYTPSGTGFFLNNYGVASLGTTMYDSTNTGLQLMGRGIAIKNDRDGSNNNWTRIQNRATGSGSDLYFGLGSGNIRFDHGGAIITNAVSGYHNYINAGQADSDFIVRTQGNTNMLHVDGATNRVGIGFGSPAYTLELQASVSGDWVSRLYNTHNNGLGVLVRTNATAANNQVAFGVYTDSQYLISARSNGRVGIKNTAPSEVLTVGGVIAASASSYTVNATTANFGFYNGGGTPVTYAQMPASGKFELWKQNTGAYFIADSGGRIGIQKVPVSTVSLSIAAQASTSSSYGLEVTNATSNTRFLVDGTGNAWWYKTDNAVGMRWDASNSRLGVNVSSPSYTLDVRGNARIGNGTSSEQDILFSAGSGDWQVGTNASGNGYNSNQFYVFDNNYRFTVQKGANRVGIGTNAPVGTLELNNGSSAVELQFKETSTAYHRLGIKKLGSQLQLGEYNNDGTSLTPILTLDGNGENATFASAITSGSVNTIRAGHSTTRLHLEYRYSGGDNQYNSDLLLWASEPGMTYDNCGIGGNIHEQGPYYGRADNNNPYGVYMRFDVNNGYTEFWNTQDTRASTGGQGTRRARIDGGGNFNLFTGALQIAGTSAIDASRNFYANNYYYANGQIVVQASDAYLRINQSNQFGGGTWFGSSNVLQATAYIASGSNGGTTNSRVYIYGGNYNGSNVIALDGTDGKIKGSYYQVGGTNVILSNTSIRTFQDFDMYSTGSNTTAYAHADARDDTVGGARIHRYNYSPSVGYRPYYENWYDGSSYHSIGVDGDVWKLSDGLDVSGAVTASGQIFTSLESSSALKSRFIMGKASGSTADGELYLQYGSYSRVYIGAGGSAGLDVYGSLRLNEGSASAPSLTFMLDDNTGFYRSGSGDVSLSSNGTQAMELKAYGVDMTMNSNGYVDLNRSGFITFYGNASAYHGIGSRDHTGSATDDLRINSFAQVAINLDSNNNNTADSNFIIGRHGAATGTMDLLMTVSGENGNLTTEGNVTAYGSTSDIRLKENIEVIPNALEKVQKLRGITFNYKKDGSRSTGLIAQELEEVLPEVVYTATELDGENEHLAVRYGNTVGLLVEAIKEQQQQIETLKQTIEEMKNGSNKNEQD